MAGLFDDLIPEETSVVGKRPQGSSDPFADLVPEQTTTVAKDDPFADLIPQGATAAEVLPTPSAATPQEQSFLGGLSSSIGRGWNEVQAGGGAVAFSSGMMDAPTAARFIAEQGQEADLYAKTPQQVALEAALNDGGGFWNSAADIVTNPRGSLNLAAESIPASATSAVGAAGLGLAGTAVAPGVGTVAGASVGAGLGSAVSEYGSSYKNYLAEKGVNTNDPVAVEAALNDANLANEAHWYAAKRAGAIGLFDAIGGRLGGKVASKFWTPDASVFKRIGGAGLGTGTDMLTEGAGEASAQLIADGRINPSAITAEALLSLPTSAMDMSIGAIAERYSQGAPEPMDEVQGDPAQSVLPQVDNSDNFGMTPRDKIIRPGVDAIMSTSDPEVRAPFYSAVKRLVETKGPNTAPARDWDGLIRNAPGIKPEEVDWLRIPEYLRDVNGKVSKEDLLSHIEENEIRLEEFRLSEDPPRGDMAVQYKDYTLPGGTNYRETLLKLPTRTVKRATTDMGRPTGRVIDSEEGNFYSTHWNGQPNVVAHVRSNERVDRDGKRNLFIEEIQSDWHQQARTSGYKIEGDNLNDKQLAQIVNRESLSPEDISILRRYPTITRAVQNDYNRTKLPDAPFKTSWAELAFKRMLREAADRGLDRISWAPGSVHNARYGFDAEPVDEQERAINMARRQGMNEFYNEILPHIARKYARKFGTEMGRTLHEIPTDPTDPYGLVDTVESFYLDVNPTLVSAAQQGMPLFAQSPAGWGDAQTSTEMDDLLLANPDPHNVVPAIKQAFKVVQDLAKQMGIVEPIHLQLFNHKSYGFVQPLANYSQFILNISPVHNKTPEWAYAHVMHEFGHIVALTAFHRAPKEVQFGVHAAYTKWRETVSLDDRIKDILRRKANMVKVQQLPEGFFEHTAAQADRPEYWVSFDEWFAEQVAKWATTKARPISIVDQFFSALGNRLRQMFESMSSALRLHFQPVEAMANWLDSYVASPLPIGQPVLTDAQIETRKRNKNALEAADLKGVTAVPQQPETSFTRSMVQRMFGGRPPKTVMASLAMNDRFNWMYKWMLSLPQVAARNRDIRSLQLYKEDVALMQLEKAGWMNESLGTLKSWKKLAKRQQDAVSTTLDDLTNMVYLTPEDRRKKVTRWPTQEEFDAIARKYKLSVEGLQVVRTIIRDFGRSLIRYRELLVLEAQKISDPIAQAQRMTDIDDTINRMKKAPYFPAMRFGDLTITVRDKDGRVTWFETFETDRERKAAFKRINAAKEEGEIVRLGALNAQSRPLLGLPPGLLDMINEKLQLSDEQRSSLEELKFQLSPAQSFKHRFQRKRRIGGYSMDFQRAYANYFFHGANHMARVKHVDRLRKHIQDVQQQADFMPDGTRRKKIGNFMADHLQELMDPTPDFAILRNIAFVWHLGFDAASAMVNLTQMPVMTYPYLASYFGDRKTAIAMANASRKLSTFYKQASLEKAAKAGTDEEIEALNEAVQEGIITEAMAPELAGLTNGNNLTGAVGNMWQQSKTWLLEKSAYMFQLAEQMNRRVTFRAAWQLAKENPQAPYMRQLLKTHERQYRRLTGKGWTHENAMAFVAAKDIVEKTQFTYGAHAQPRFMRGKMKSVLVFKSFVQNTLFALWNNKPAAARSILVMGALGGMMGLPGAEDAEDVLKGLAFHLFGKDFSPEKEARKWIIEHTDDPRLADMAIHGMAREGFGLPMLLEMMGVHAPVFDSSRAVGLGRISPIDLGALFAPGRQGVDERIARATQTAAGAAIGIPFNIYRALMDAHLAPDDFKRWEQAMPGFLKQLSRAYRYGVEGEERSRDGATLVEYDATDPTQFAEVMGVALGYTPTRQSRMWDREIAAKEAVAFIDVRRQMLLRQYDWALRSGEVEERKEATDAIADFNKSLAPEAAAKKITRKTIEQSLAARNRNRAAREAGTSVRKTDRGLIDATRNLYPGESIQVQEKVVR